MAFSEQDFKRFLGRGQKAAQGVDVISEKSWQGQVNQLLDVLGWRYYHTFRSKGSEEGFPDLIALRGGRRLVAELKREGQKPTRAQQAWLDDFEEHGFEIYVWLPSDIDEVMRILR